MMRAYAEGLRRLRWGLSQRERWVKRIGTGIRYAAWLAMWTVFCAAWFVHPWWMKVLMIPLGVLTRYVTPYAIMGAMMVVIAGAVAVGWVVFIVLAIPYCTFIYLPLHAEEIYRKDGRPRGIRPSG